jgi:hypothetical protein
VAGLQISSHTVARQRGIRTRFPPLQANEDAQTKEVVKDLNWIVGKIYSLAEGKSINPRCVAWSRTDLNGKFPF